MVTSASEIAGNGVTVENILYLERENSYLDERRRIKVYDWQKPSG